MPPYNLNSSLPPAMMSKSHKFAIAFGTAIGCIGLLVLAAGFLFWWRHRRNRQVLFDVDGKETDLPLWLYHFVAYWEVNS